MIKQIKIRVSGLFQCVGFRFFTHQKAQKLGLVGYVKNLDNGDVEIVAQGDSVQISKLTEWLEQGGPVSARINNINIDQSSVQEDLTSFKVRY